MDVWQWLSHVPATMMGTPTAEFRKLGDSVLIFKFYLFPDITELSIMEVRGYAASQCISVIKCLHSANMPHPPECTKPASIETSVMDACNLRSARRVQELSHPSNADFKMRLQGKILRIIEI